MAEHKLSGSDKPDVKIAICPEHFLAKQHGYNPKDITQPEVFHNISEIIPIFQKLKILSDKHPDWLIIPGTITVFGLNTITGSDFKFSNFNSERILSTSYVSQDARATNETLLESLQKKANQINSKPEIKFRPCYNVSPIYFRGKIVKIRRKIFEAYDGDNSLDVVGKGSETAYFPMSYGNPVLKHEGLNIGVEICAEHEHGLLRAEVSRKLDLHIIISNDVCPFQEHTSLAENGYLIHVGSTMTGIYKSNELPLSSESLEFEYKNTSKPGVYGFDIEVGI